LGPQLLVQLFVRHWGLLMVPMRKSGVAMVETPAAGCGCSGSMASLSVVPPTVQEPGWAGPWASIWWWAGGGTVLLSESCSAAKHSTAECVGESKNG
jgi:hypothetical protein